MTWNIQTIPKQIFFYWGSPRMSFLRWMTLVSFRYFNPDWKIYLYVPIIENKNVYWANKMFDNESINFIDYTDKLDKLNIEIIKFDFRKIGQENSLNEIHKSDLIRYFLLYTEGGVYADMDILWIAPISNMKANYEENKSAYIYYGLTPGGNIHNPGHAIGFLMSSQGDSLYGSIYQQASELLLTQSTDYQLIGADLLNRKFQLTELKRYKKLGYLDKEAVYSIDHDARKYLYELDGTSLLDKKSIGIHWYGGSEYVRTLIHTLNHENYFTYRNNGTLIKMLRRRFKNLESYL